MSTKTFYRLALEACKMGYALDLKKKMEEFWWWELIAKLHFDSHSFYVFVTAKWRGRWGDFFESTECSHARLIGSSYLGIWIFFWFSPRGSYFSVEINGIELNGILPFWISEVYRRDWMLNILILIYCALLQR